ncbi:MAG TPA: class I SAM-dependent methyltransferase, partial [Pirellulales bacterium]
MFISQQYELLDFGDGRKLERFGDRILDRPSPAADTEQRQQKQTVWSTASAVFERSSGSKEFAAPNSIRGQWRTRHNLPAWTISPILSNDKIQFELKLTDFGHVGIFPEQALHWDWIAQQIRASSGAHGDSIENDPPERFRVLNLFAYTGGSTLAAAAAGAAVTHVDAAKNIVAWARRNAELSALSAAPIRWIAEDAMKFVRREIKRGQQYDAIILDPPTYGHGAGGEVWKLDSHLPELLAMCKELIGPSPNFVILTCHSAPYDPR